MRESTPPLSTIAACAAIPERPSIGGREGEGGGRRRPLAARLRRASLTRPLPEKGEESERLPTRADARQCDAWRCPIRLRYG